MKKICILSILGTAMFFGTISSDVCGANQESKKSFTRMRSAYNSQNPRNKFQKNWNNQKKTRSYRGEMSSWDEMGSSSNTNLSSNKEEEETEEPIQTQRPKRTDIGKYYYKTESSSEEEEEEESNENKEAILELNKDEAYLFDLIKSSRWASARRCFNKMKKENGIKIRALTKFMLYIADNLEESDFNTVSHWDEMIKDTYEDVYNKTTNKAVKNYIKTNYPAKVGNSRGIRENNK